MKPEEKLSICIIDDDEMFLKALMHQLKEKFSSAIKIKSFQSGEKFLKNAAEEKPNIVILDYILNDLNPYAMDGRSVLQKIKQTYPEIIVIMLSGQNKIEIALESIREGAYDYVIKNDNAFLKIQTVLKNAIEVVLVSKQLRKYKWWAITVAMIISIVIIISSTIKIFFY